MNAQSIQDRSRFIRQWFRSVGSAILLCALLSGCSVAREVSKTPRTPVEQALLSQAIERALNEATDLLTPRKSARVEVDGFTDDRYFAREITAEWLRKQGWHITAEKARYRVHLMMYALGTEQQETFFGMPPVSGSLVPISVGEIALYKANRQRGFSRFALVVSELPEGRLIASTPVLEGDVYFNQYTVLLNFNFHRTDLLPPPPP